MVGAGDRQRYREVLEQDQEKEREKRGCLEEVNPKIKV